MKSSISIIIVTYNSEDIIEDCLLHLIDSVSQNVEIVLVDNNSFDGTISKINKFVPRVKLVKSVENLGYSGGNNIGVKNSNGDYILFMNADVTVTKKFLEPLVEILNGNKNVSATQPLVLLSNNRKKINLTGKTLHYVGLEWCSDYGNIYDKENLNVHEIQAISGSCFLVRRSVYDKVGGFDDKYFMYGEDSDLSWRIRSIDKKLVFVPNSIVYHDYKFLVNKKNLALKKKFYYVERNRLINILTGYQLKSLLILFPALLVTEAGICLYSMLNGLLKSKIKGYLFLFRNVKYLMKKRRTLMSLRTVGDKILLEDAKSSVNYNDFGGKGIVLFNIFWGIYWKLVKKFI